MRECKGADSRYLASFTSNSGEDTTTGEGDYRIFQTIRCTFSPHLGEKWECILKSGCSLPGSRGWGQTAVGRAQRRQEQDHIFCFKFFFPIFL